MTNMHHDIPNPHEMRKKHDKGPSMILAHMAPDEVEMMAHLQGGLHKSKTDGVPEFKPLWNLMQNPHIQMVMHHSGSDGYHGPEHLHGHLEQLRREGRNADTELVRIPREMSHLFDNIIGGPSINPHTGKHEYFLGSILSGLSSLAPRLMGMLPSLGGLASSAAGAIGRAGSALAPMAGRAAGALGSGLSSMAGRLPGLAAGAARGMARAGAGAARGISGAASGISNRVRGIPAPAPMPALPAAAPAAPQSWSDWAGAKGRSVGSGVGSSVGGVAGSIAGGQLGSGGAGALVRNFVPGGSLLQYPARLAGGLSGGLIGNKIGQHVGSSVGGNVGQRIGQGIGSGMDYVGQSIPAPVANIANRAYQAMPSPRGVASGAYQAYQDMPSVSNMINQARMMPAAMVINNALPSMMAAAQRQQPDYQQNFHQALPALMAAGRGMPRQPQEDQFFDQDDSAYNAYRAPANAYSQAGNGMYDLD